MGVQPDVRNTFHDAAQILRFDPMSSDQHSGEFPAPETALQRLRQNVRRQQRENGFPGKGIRQFAKFVQHGKRVEMGLRQQQHPDVDAP